MESEKKEKVLIEDGTEVLASLEEYKEVDTKAGDGRRGTLVFNINRPSNLNGQKQYDDLMVNLPKSPKAEEIAVKKLNEFLKATGEAPDGLESIDHDRTRLEEFKGIQVKLVIGQKEAKGYTNKDGIEVAPRQINYIKKYLAY